MIYTVVTVKNMQCCSVLPHVAVCCRAKQCVASVLQCVRTSEVSADALIMHAHQWVVINCSVLQCVAISYFVRTSEVSAEAHERSPTRGL